MQASYTEIIEKVNQAFRDGDAGAFLAFCTEETVWDMGPQGRHTGSAALTRVVENAEFTLPEITMDEIIVEGDRAAATGHMRMTHKGQGFVVDVDFCDIFHFQDGKIKTLRSYMVDTKS